MGFLDDDFRVVVASFSRCFSHSFPIELAVSSLQGYRRTSSKAVVVASRVVVAAGVSLSVRLPKQHMFETYGTFKRRDVEHSSSR